MRSLLCVFAAGVLLVFVACTGLDKKGSAEVPTPVGPINSGGTPDLSKTKGDLDQALGGEPNAGGAADVSHTNTGGAPNVKKTNTKTGPGQSNTGGKADVSKSIPKSAPKK